LLPSFRGSVAGCDATNIYALLTTYYLPAWGGYLLLVVIGALFVLAQVRARRQRREHGFAVEDSEVGFLKAFVGLQGLLLFAIVMNGFRGIPLSVVILGVVALLVYVVTQHTPFGRYLYAIGDNEEARGAWVFRSRRS
jgi:D-xylose transport system permease protein